MVKASDQGRRTQLLYIPHAHADHLYYTHPRFASEILKRIIGRAFIVIPSIAPLDCGCVWGGIGVGVGSARLALIPSFIVFLGVGGVRAVGGAVVQLCRSYTDECSAHPSTHKAIHTSWCKHSLLYERLLSLP